jgi:hypothetical protein
MELFRNSGTSECLVNLILYYILLHLILLTTILITFQHSSFTPPNSRLWSTFLSKIKIWKRVKLSFRMLVLLHTGFYLSKYDLSRVPSGLIITLLQAFFSDKRYL